MFARLECAPATQAGEEAIAQSASLSISTSVDIFVPSIRAHADLATPSTTTDTSAAPASKGTLVRPVLSLFVLETAALQALVLLQEYVPVIEGRWERIAS